MIKAKTERPGDRGWSLGFGVQRPGHGRGINAGAKGLLIIYRGERTSIS